MFRELGIPVICADELAHDAVKTGSPALREIREVFGDEVFDQYGELDRLKLGSRVFGNPLLKKQLEQIIHPAVALKKQELLDYYVRQGHPIVVIDVPLLFEAEWDKAVDVILVVYVSRDLQAERLVQRNGLSAEEAQARLNSQWSIEDKKDKAHMVIDNSGSIEETRIRFKQVIDELRAMAPS
jgi:dephospho-CoA kinase